MARRKQPTPVQRLVAAMDACALARSEAQWTNGYRAAAGAKHPDEARLYAKEQRQWQHVARAERRFRRLAQRLIREARDGE